MIDVVLLGTGAMVPLLERWLSSALVRVDGSLILFDCGEGTQIAMREVHWGFRRLDTILLSHLHADHVAGLPGLFHTVANAGRTEPMRIYGPPGTERVIAGLRVIAEHLPYEIAVTEVDDGARVALPGGLTGAVGAALHRVPCLAYRLTAERRPPFRRDRAFALGVPRQLWSRLQDGEAVMVDGRMVLPAEVMGDDRPGVSLGLITDTRPTARLTELVRDVDLLICEATYAEDDEAPKAERHRHMTIREAATLAANAGARQLWLTHFGAGMTDPAAYGPFARGLFPRTEIGSTGLAASLTFRRGYERIDLPPRSPAEQGNPDERSVTTDR